MRIMFATGSLDIGGSERQTVRLAYELRRRGHDVEVLAMISGGALEGELQRLDIPYVVGDWKVRTRAGFPPEGFFELPGWKRQLVAMRGRPGRVWSKSQQIRRMWRLLAEFDPDICHAPLPHAFYTMLPGARLAGVPGRISGRRALPSATDTRLSLRALTALSTLCANAVVTNSAELARDAIAHEWIRPRNLVVIPNGVDIPDQPTDVSGAGAPGLMIANFQPAKGHRNLVAALPLVEAAHRPVIHLLGDGVERRPVEAAIAEAGLDAWLPREGQVPDAASWLGRARFCVQPSNDEGLPNAILESMAAGVPVVATRVGGIPELLEDGVEGLLVEPGDPAALAAAITRISTDEALRVRLGAAARERARSFSWDACTEQHVRLYEELLRAHPRRRDRRRRLIPSAGPNKTGE
jgi:glycosyltransferase involved in cell wall biosynthesis